MSAAVPSGPPEIIDAISGARIENGEVGPLTLNETVRLTCRVRQGVPLPSVHWELGPDERAHELHELTTPSAVHSEGWVASRLTLTHLERSDLNRRLKCVAQQAPLDAFTTKVVVNLDINRK